MSAFRRSKGARPLIHGHRGVRGPVPENTMRAFALAHSHGADGIELDVRQAKSGELIVFHDPTLARMTQGFDRRELASLSRAELRHIDFGGEAVPLLDDVLDWLAPLGLLLNVEIKRDVPDRIALTLAVARTLKRRPSLKERLLVSSFDPFMLTALNLLLPGIPKALLFHAGQAHLHPFTIARLGPWQATHPEQVMFTAPLTQPHRITNAWTVNDPARARTLSDYGVDGLITDDPEVLLATFTALPPPGSSPATR